MDNYGSGISQRGFLSKKRGGTIIGDVLYQPASGPINQLTEVTNKSYVDALVAGLAVGKQLLNVTAGTTIPLSACTAGGAGVGKTLTANVAEVLIIDAVTIPLNGRVLIKDQAATKDNGVYSLTTVGTVVIPWVLTRTTDLDATSEATEDVWVFIENGTTNHDAGFKITTAPAALDSDPLLWSQFTGGAVAPAPNLATVLTTGNSAGSKKITTLLDPTANQDAATKHYVDLALGTASEWLDPVESQTVTDPSTLTPSVGERWIVGNSAVGVWAGHDKEIATWGGSWTFLAATTGEATVVKDEAAAYVWSGTAWVGSTLASYVKKIGDLMSGKLRIYTNVDDNSLDVKLNFPGTTTKSAMIVESNGSWPTAWFKNTRPNSGGTGVALAASITSALNNQAVSTAQTAGMGNCYEAVVTNAANVGYLFGGTQIGTGYGVKVIHTAAGGSAHAGWFESASANNQAALIAYKNNTTGHCFQSTIINTFGTDACTYAYHTGLGALYSGTHQGLSNIFIDLKDIATTTFLVERTGAITTPKFKVTAEGGYAVYLTNMSGATSVKGDIVAIGLGEISEAGDASNQLSAWQLNGIYIDTNLVTSNADITTNVGSATLYWNLTDAAGTRTVSIFKDSAKTAKVAEGTRAGDGVVTLTAQNASGITGSVSVAYTTDDTDAGNTLITKPDSCYAKQTDTYAQIGVVYAAATNGAGGYVVVNGIAEVLLKDSTAATAGYLAVASTTDGRAEVTAAPGTTVDVITIGKCIQNKEAGTNVLAKVVLGK